jgi:Macrocin-O-methyltransferase (TylF)
MSDEASWESYNEFLLYGATDRFAKILSRYELFKRVSGIPGDIVECGVFKGTGVLFWAKLIQIFHPMSLRKVVGFDTFGEFPATSDVDRKFAADMCSEAAYEGTDPAALMDIAGQCGVRGRVELIRGDATLTLPEYVAGHPGFRIALLNLDFDTYAPTRAALDALYDCLVPGGIVICDEYGLSGCSESDAIDSYLQEHRLSTVRLHSIRWNMSPTAWFVKP